jgi:hypothetical protein
VPLEKFGSEKKSKENLENLDNKTILEKELDDDSDVLFRSRVSEIKLNNLTSVDLMRIKYCIDIKDTILNSGEKVALKFEEAKNEFLKEISQGYSEEELENCALYHILIASEIGENVEHLDLEGEYSIEEFIRAFATENL